MAQSGTRSCRYPDFVVKDMAADVWIVETKGREELDDPLKFERLRQWCADASRLDPERDYRAIYLREDDWEAYQVSGFAEFVATYEAPPRV